jgi:hypothetical protein
VISTGKNGPFFIFYSPAFLKLWYSCIYPSIILSASSTALVATINLLAFAASAFFIFFFFFEGSYSSPSLPFSSSAYFYKSLFSSF